MSRRRADRETVTPRSFASREPAAAHGETHHKSSLHFGRKIVIGVIAGGILAAGLSAFLWEGDARLGDLAESTPSKPIVLTPEHQQKIKETCSHCHRLPPPDTLPQDAWKETIWQMFENSGFGRTVRWRVDPETAIAWYEQHSPETFVFDSSAETQAPLRLPPFSHEPIGIQSPYSPALVANIQVTDLMGDDQSELIVCDALHGQVLLGTIDHVNAQLRAIADVPNPCHAEVADLDADNLADIVVANLGSFLAMDHNLGSVEWLHQTATGTFERITIKDGLGRVADVEPTDFDDDGDLDVVVAEFGWHSTGQLLLLENCLTDKNSPGFLSHAIDGIHGASHVDVVDLDGDGVDEIVVLYSQGHEMIRCYSRQPGGVFVIRDLYRAPSPAWGFTGSQIVDFDVDGDLDILLSNGDMFDNTIVKPYHGVQWLENLGDFEFEAHQVGTLYGAYRAAAADLDGDGDQDVAACALIPLASSDLAQFGEALESVVWFEQTTSGTFVRHRLEAGQYDHPTLATADYDQDGDVDLLVGSGRLDMSVAAQHQGCIELWLNETK